MLVICISNFKVIEIKSKWQGTTTILDNKQKTMLHLMTNNKQKSPIFSTFIDYIMALRHILADRDPVCTFFFHSTKNSQNK